VPNRNLCLTPGDPQGIGPEVTVKFITRHLHRYPDLHLDVIGSLSALHPQVTCIDNDPYQAIETAVQRMADKKADALVTGPITKRHGGGHTEILETLARKLYPNVSSKAEMLFVHHNFRLLLLTRHIPLHEISGALTPSACEASLEILIHFLHTRFGIAMPRIAVLGVNPHAGEIGGQEESEILIPVLNRLNHKNQAHLEGPFAADGFFRGFKAETPGYDAIVAPYHDQGLIPFKLIAGHQAVNVTIGLPFIRTSVGHGTAFDIAGQGIADESGLVAAIDTALQLLDAL